jgi:hypothetical protein
VAVAAASWITLAQFKTYAAITTVDTNRDAQLETIIDGVSSSFCQFLGREMSKTTYTDEYVDGSGMPDLLLRNYPIVSISALTEEDVALTEGIDNDYLLYAKEGRLHKPSAVWTEWPKNVKLTYIAGYTVQGATPGTGETALPQDLALACKLQVGAEWKRSQRMEWGLSAITLPEGSITQMSMDVLLPQVRGILRRYMGTMAE